MKLAVFQRRAGPIALAGCLFFFLAGQLVLPLLGIQDDEALFGMVIFKPKSWAYMLKIRHTEIGLMLMSYLGALKSWIYKPLLLAFGTGVHAIREPILIATAVGIWLFFLLLRRSAGPRAAVIGCGLLATDTLYLLTSVFDWGPVALQHLLIVGGMLLAVRFYQERSEWSLIAAAFLFGLALWDKALAAWMISGLGIAALLFFWREVHKLITVRRVAVAAAAFALGALPLILYNASENGVTFRENMQKETSELDGKARLLLSTLDGRGLIGTLTDEERSTPAPHRPQGIFQNASVRLAALSGDPVSNLMPYGFLLALLLAPAARGRGLRTIGFALLALLIAWIQMAVTKGAGGSVHHSILVWPLPHIVMAVSFAAASYRVGRGGFPAVAAITAVLMISQALVTNEYYVRMVHKGGSLAWSDAIFPLADSLKAKAAPAVFAVDWDILDNLRVMGAGRIAVRDAIEHTAPQHLSSSDRDYVRAMLDTPGALFVTHTQSMEFFHGNADRLAAVAAEKALRRETLETVFDSFGRPTFEIFRFIPISLPPPEKASR